MRVAISVLSPFATSPGLGVVKSAEGCEMFLERSRSAGVGSGHLVPLGMFAEHLCASGRWLS